MSLRFFVSIPPGPAPEEIILDENETRHAVSVHRIRQGEKIDLFDGRGRRMTGTAAEVSSGRLRVLVKEVSTADFPSPLEVTLGVSLFKLDAMEVLVQKACELGAHAIIPIETERSVIRVDAQRWAPKEKRWQKIIQESCKQCGLAYQPQLLPLCRFEDLLKSFESYERVLIPTIGPRTHPLGEVLSTARPRSILALIGPEGDFSPAEVDLATAAGALPVSLGPLVLRSETAGIYVLSAIHFFYREVWHG